MMARDPPTFRSSSQAATTHTAASASTAQSATHASSAAPAATAAVAAAASSSLSPTSLRSSPLSDVSPSQLPRPSRDDKNLLQFRIPHDVPNSSSASGASASGRRSTSPHTYSQQNPPPAAPAPPAALVTPPVSTWAAAIAASVKPSPQQPQSRQNSGDGSSKGTPTTQPRPMPAVVSANAAPAPSVGGTLSATPSPLPNAWHRSDKPQWAAAAAQPNPNAAAVTARKSATSSSSGSPSTAAAAAAAAPAVKPLPPAAAHAPAAVASKPSVAAATPTVASEASSNASSKASSTKKSAASSTARSTSKPKSSAAGSSNASSSTVAASKPATAAASSSSSLKKVASKSGSTKNAAKPAAAAASKTPDESPPSSHAASDVEASPSLPPAADPAAVAAASASHPQLPTVNEAIMSRSNSSELPPPITPLELAPPATVASQSDAASPQPPPDDLALQPSPSLLPLETPPESDLLAPLPAPQYAVPALSLTRRTAGVSNLLPRSGVKSGASSGAPSSSELTKRLWSHLLDNLSRTTNELFYLCHMHMSSTQAARCRQVLYHLQSTTKDFTKLLAHAEQKSTRKMSTTGATTTAAAAALAATAAVAAAAAKDAAASSASSSASKPLSRSRKSTTPSSLKVASSASSKSSVSPSSPSTTATHARVTSKSSTTAAAAREEAEAVAAAAAETKKRSSSIKPTAATSSSSSKKKATAPAPPAELAPAQYPAASPTVSPPLHPAHPHHPHHPLSIGEGTLFGLLGLSGRSFAHMNPPPGLGHPQPQQQPQQQPQGARTPPHSRHTRTATPQGLSGSPQATRIPVLGSPTRTNAASEPVAPGSASKWNAFSDLLGSGTNPDATDEPAAGPAPVVRRIIEPTAPSASAAPTSSSSSSSIAAAPASKPPQLPKSAWNSQSQTQHLLAIHKNGSEQRTGAQPSATAGHKPVSTLSTSSPVFKPMLSLAPVADLGTIISVDGSAAIELEPLTPPTISQRAAAAGGSGRNNGELSPLQKRLNSPDRVQARLRIPFAVALAAGAASVDAANAAAAAGDATAASSASTVDPAVFADAEALVADALKLSYDVKQEKAARNREQQLHAQRRKLQELNNTRIADVEMRRESRIAKKGSSTESRLAQAAEVYDAQLENRRRRAVSENQKVAELAFINEQMAEERKFSIVQKQSDSDMRVKLMQEEKMRSIRANNATKSSIIDQEKQKREVQGSLSKKTAEHERIDARLELAEARRLQGKVKKNSNSSSAVGTPAESPFQSPRPGTAGSTTSAGAADSSYSAQAGIQLNLGLADQKAIASASPDALSSEVASADLECSFCSLCKVKLYSDEYVSRHVVGKKHQTMLSQQLVMGQSSIVEPLATPISAVGDGYIVNYSSLLTAASRPANATMHRVVDAEPAIAMLEAPSKSSRRNLQKKKRKLRKQLVNEIAGDEQQSGGEEAEEAADAAAAATSSEPARPKSAPSKRKESAAAEPSLDEVHAMPPTRLKTQVLSFLALLQRADKMPLQLTPQNQPQQQAPLLLVSESLELELQEELQSILVRLDDESAAQKSDANAVQSPPALKLLLVSKLIQYFVAALLSSASSFSSEILRLAAEVMYSCCRSSPLVGEMLLAKHKLLPIVDLASQALQALTYTHSVNVNPAANAPQPLLAPTPGAGGVTVLSVHTPPAPPEYIEFILLTLTLVLQERDDPNAAAVTATGSLAATSSSACPAAEEKASPPVQRSHSKDRQHLIRYICLSSLLSRIAQQFLGLDRYMTVVSAASVSAASLALAASAPSSALNSPNAAAGSASRTLPAASKAGAVALPKTPKERMTAKLGASRSLKAGSVAAAGSKESTPSKSPQPLLPSSSLPIHTPVVPHATFYLRLVELLEALTMLPIDAGQVVADTINAPSPAPVGMPAKRPMRASLYHTALARALTDTAFAGILSLIGSVTISHWIVPSKPSSSSSGPAAPVPSTHEKALSTVLTHEITSLLLCACRVFNNIARVDLPLLQDFTDTYQPHVFDLLSFLLPYCTSHLPKANITSTTVHNQLLELLILVMGSISLLSPAHQRMMTQWRQGANDGAASASATSDASSSSSDADRPAIPTLFQQLCHLPAHFYTEPRLQNLLFPTLLAMSYDPAHTTGPSVLASELSAASMQHLLIWMDNMSSGTTRSPESTEGATAASPSTPSESLPRAVRSSPPPVLDVSSASSSSSSASTTAAAAAKSAAKKKSAVTKPALSKSASVSAAASKRASLKAPLNGVEGERKGSAGSDTAETAASVAASIAALAAASTAAAPLPPASFPLSLAAPLRQELTRRFPAELFRGARAQMEQ